MLYDSFYQCISFQLIILSMKFWVYNLPSCKVFNFLWRLLELNIPDILTIRASYRIYLSMEPFSLTSSLMKLIIISSATCIYSVHSAVAYKAFLNIYPLSSYFLSIQGLIKILKFYKLAILTHNHKSNHLVSLSHQVRF